MIAESNRLPCSTLRIFFKTNREPIKQYGGGGCDVERIRHSEHRDGDSGISRLQHLGRCTSPLSTKNQGHWTDRYELFGMDAGGALLCNYDPSASGFRFGNGLGCTLAFAPSTQC
jgi:hypothetical protein